jgi:hypothetical protein
MPTFSSRDKQVITILAPRDRVAAALSSPDRIKEFLADEIDVGEAVDERTLHIVRKPIEEKGVRFRGDYIVRYTRDGDATVTWQTISKGNMRSQGEARLTALDAARTRLEYEESIECDMEVNRILGAVLRPIVEYKIKTGIAAYLVKVKAGIERG